MKESIKNLWNKTSKTVALILLGILLTVSLGDTFFGDKKPQIQIFEAGAVSVSINEKGELIFLDRDYGNPAIVDSTLTEIINQMLEAKEYQKSFNK